MELVKYDAACRALAEARTIDEINEITSRAEAARAYARQAKNKNLELDALEIRVRAERRLGEVLLLLREAGTIGQGRGGRPVKLDEIGVDARISGGAQRLAKLPQDRFVQELSDWRRLAETSQRIVVPLQTYRIPSIRGTRQKAAHRHNRHQLDAVDPLDRFRTMDGRKVADWRLGELSRLREMGARIVACVDHLRDGLPVANGDPLDTMEMIYDRTALLAILRRLFDEPLPQVDAGLKREAKNEEDGLCANCGKPFNFKRDGLKRKQGVFCSRSCAGTSLNSTRSHG